MNTHRKGLLHNLFHIRILVCCTLAIVLSFGGSAVAGYRPPASQKSPSGYTESSGVRGGCQANGVGEVVLLAPRQHVGQTTAVYPEFAWFVPQKQTMLVEFSLYEFDENGEPTQLVYQRELPALQGVQKISLPQEISGLKVGKKYLWQVESLCNGNRPSENFLVRAEMEVVDMPADLRAALAATSDRAQKVKLFAASGMWYDALEEASQQRDLLAFLWRDLMRWEQGTDDFGFPQVSLGF
jgi:hypothetical protein